jgi:hypothetical protein
VIHRTRILNSQLARHGRSIAKAQIDVKVYEWANLILLKNLRLPFTAVFGWRWVQTDEAQVGTSQKLPAHPFPGLQIQGGG